MDPESLLMAAEWRDPWSVLSADRMRKAIAICDYMLGEGRLNRDPNQTLSGLAERLVDAGLPLDRCVTIVRILHAINSASYRAWERGRGTTNNVFHHGPVLSGMYEKSPPALAHKTRRWVTFNPQGVADDTFGVVPELKQAGFTHYICAPVFFANSMANVFTFATRDPAGFSDEDVALLRATYPAMAACQEILVIHRIMKEVTRTYLGHEPHERILSGDVHRGEVTEIVSAILFADMRGFTSLTAEMTAERATALLNEYYDCVVPAVENHGGEVLKFIGDGVLAIFRAENAGSDESARALLAAQAGLAAVAQRNKTGAPRFEIGIALHFGEAAYGNVGSGVRLDYTVIGRDVNMASRIATLCGQLAKPLLVSSDFRDRLPDNAFLACGLHPLKGLVKPVAVFAPAP